jgi:hypothetical protein
VQTNSDGEYDLGLWMNFDIHIRKADVWVSAPGHYDSRQRHPSRRLDLYDKILSTLPWTEPDATPAWSLALTPRAAAASE